MKHWLNCHWQHQNKWKQPYKAVRRLFNLLVIGAQRSAARCCTYLPTNYQNIKHFSPNSLLQKPEKPIAYAENETQRCLTTIRLAAEEALRFTGETVPVDYGAGIGKTAMTQPHAIGPVAAISPFNFPLNLALHKIAPALAVGCSIVLKPSPLAPLSALAFAELVHEVGYPEGTLNVLVCENEVAQKLVEDDRMKLLSFTGSPAIGWKLKSLAGKKKNHP